LDESGAKGAPLSLAWHDARLLELQALRSSDPMWLVAKYCRITDQPVTSQLPARTSFSGMIEAILADEATRQAAVVSDEPSP
jgi:hypothetical protein